MKGPDKTADGALVFSDWLKDQDREAEGLYWEAVGRIQAYLTEIWLAHGEPEKKFLDNRTTHQRVFEIGSSQLRLYLSLTWSRISLRAYGMSYGCNRHHEKKEDKTMKTFVVIQSREDRQFEQTHGVYIRSCKVVERTTGRVIKHSLHYLDAQLMATNLNEGMSVDEVLSRPGRLTNGGHPSRWEYLNAKFGCNCD